MITGTPAPCAGSIARPVRLQRPHLVVGHLKAGRSGPRLADRVGPVVEIEVSFMINSDRHVVAGRGRPPRAPRNGRSRVVTIRDRSGAGRSPDRPPRPATAGCRSPVNTTSSGRAPTAAATTSRARSSAWAASRPGRCSRSGSPHPARCASIHACCASGSIGSPEEESRKTSESGCGTPPNLRVDRRVDRRRARRENRTPDHP